MLDKRTLAKINERPQGRGVAPYAALGALAAAGAVAGLLSYAAGGAVLLAGAALVFFLRKRDAEAHTMRIRCAPEGEAVETLAAVEKVWSVEEEPKEADGVSGGSFAFAGAAKRRPIEVGLLDTPGFSADVEVRGIRAAGGLGLFFLPECVLVLEEERYRAVSYEAFGAVYRPSLVAESGEVPKDAEVAGETRRHVTADGAPDPRPRPSNPRYPLVAYGLLTLTGVAGKAKPETKPGARPGAKPVGAPPGVRLRVSNKAAAVRFARAFGAGGGGEARARRDTQAERLGSAYGVLGLEPEVREMAELRMKEINAAYSHL